MARRCPVASGGAAGGGGGGGGRMVVCPPEDVLPASVVADAVTERVLAPRWAAYDGLADLTMVIDRQSVVLYCNAKIALLGYSEREIVGKSVEVLIPESYGSINHARLTRQYDPSRASSIVGSEGRHVDVLMRNGDTRPMRLSVGCLGQNFVGTLSDVRNYKRDTYRKLGVTMKYLAHECRNYLQVFENLALLEDSGHLDRGDHEGNRLVAEMKVAASSISLVFENLIDASSLEAGDYDLSRTAFRLGRLLESVHSTNGVLARERNIELQLEIPEELEALRIYGDQLRLRQAVSNLLSNAIKFAESRVIVNILLQEGTSDVGGGNTGDTDGKHDADEDADQTCAKTEEGKGGESDDSDAEEPERGIMSFFWEAATGVPPEESGNSRRAPLSITSGFSGARVPFASPRAVSSARSAQVREPTERILYVSVTDDGPGIDEAKLSTIFDRYGQLRTGNDTAGGGSGIGLHLTKLIAEAHGGRVEVVSCVPEGSTFTLSIAVPLAGPETPQPCNPEIVKRSLSASSSAVASSSPGSSVRPPMSSGSDPSQHTSSHASKREYATLQLDERLHMEFEDARVLVVDDSMVVRRLICKIVQNSTNIDKENVDQAVDGQDAVEKVAELLAASGGATYSAIFMDEDMPRMCGAEASRRIRDMCPDVHITAVTGSTNQAVHNLYREGGIDVLVKPVSARTIKNCLHRILPK